MDIQHIGSFEDVERFTCMKMQVSLLHITKDKYYTHQIF